MRRVSAALLALSLAAPAAAAPFKVLSYNVAGVPFVRLARGQRLARIARRIHDGGYDVVALQEAWLAEDVERLKRESGMPYAVHVGAGLRGSGLLLLSKWPPVERSFEVFGVKPPIFKVFFEGEALVNKGVLRARLKLPEGELDVYDTHLVSRYRPLTYRLIRLAQVYRVFESIEKHSAGRPVLVLGDFNEDSASPEHRAFADLTGLADVCVRAGAETCAPTSWAGRIDAVWAAPGALRGAPRVLTDPGVVFAGKTLAVSDHLAVEAEFERAALLTPARAQPASRLAALVRIEEALERLRGGVVWRTAGRFLVPIYNMLHFGWYRHQVEALDRILGDLRAKKEAYGKKRPVRAQ